MIGWNTLLKGVIILCLGLFFFVLKSNVKEPERSSMTGVGVIFGAYALTIMGLFLVILAFFPDDQ
jgi:hypothetical protein